MNVVHHRVSDGVGAPVVAPGSAQIEQEKEMTHGEDKSCYTHAYTVTGMFWFCSFDFGFFYYIFISMQVHTRQGTVCDGRDM